MVDWLVGWMAGWFFSISNSVRTNFGFSGIKLLGKIILNKGDMRILSPEKIIYPYMPHLPKLKTECHQGVVFTALLAQRVISDKSVQPQLD